MKKETLKKFIEKHKESISLNKGTWMNEMEKYFEGEEYTLKELEKVLNLIKAK